jgi:hypothetical protein
MAPNSPVVGHGCASLDPSTAQAPPSQVWHGPQSPADRHATQPSVGLQSGVGPVHASPQAAQSPVVPSGVQPRPAQQTEPVGHPPCASSGTGVVTQPTDGSQATEAHGPASGQTVVDRAQAPATQA